MLCSLPFAGSATILPPLLPALSLYPFPSFSTPLTCSEAKDLLTCSEAKDDSPFAYFLAWAGRWIDYRKLTSTTKYVFDGTKACAPRKAKKKEGGAKEAAEEESEAKEAVALVEVDLGTAAADK